MSDPQVEVVVIADQGPFVESLAQALARGTDGRVAVTGSTGDANLAASLVRRRRPDVVIVDLQLSEPGGLHALASVASVEPAPRLLALSAGSTRESSALRAGAHAVLPKTSNPAALLHPLLAVVEGWSVLPAGLLAELLGPGPVRSLLDRLDEEQVRLWVAVARGDDTATLARSFHVSERTAKRMVAQLLRRLGARNRIEAAALAGRVGLLDEPQEELRPSG